MELLQRHSSKAVAGTSINTDIDVILAAGTGTQTLINSIVVQNNSDELQTLTVKLQVYDTSAYVTPFQKDYAVDPWESVFLAEFIGCALIGGTTPDKISMAFDVALSGDETIDSMGSSVKFS